MHQSIIFNWCDRAKALNASVADAESRTEASFQPVSLAPFETRRSNGVGAKNPRREFFQKASDWSLVTARCVLSHSIYPRNERGSGKS